MSNIIFKNFLSYLSLVAMETILKSLAFFLNNLTPYIALNTLNLGTIIKNSMKLQHISMVSAILVIFELKKTISIYIETITMSRISP